VSATAKIRASRGSSRRPGPSDNLSVVPFVVAQDDVPDLGDELDVADQAVAEAGCLRTTSHSLGASGPGFFRMASGMAILPASWRSAPLRTLSSFLGRGRRRLRPGRACIGRPSWNGRTSPRHAGRARHEVLERRVVGLLELAGSFKIAGELFLEPAHFRLEVVALMGLGADARRDKMRQARPVFCHLRRSQDPALFHGALFIHFFKSPCKSADSSLTIPQANTHNSRAKVKERPWKTTRTS